ncbi:hypothetical protein SPHINGOR109_11243 [Sphingorhabdus sp. 109]|nr:hypothetical protein SPHINGOR109_11243 [Sphingorhabdus sp. 109]
MSAGNVRPAPDIFAAISSRAANRTLQTLHCYESQNFRGFSGGIRAALPVRKSRLFSFGAVRLNEAETGKPQAVTDRPAPLFQERAKRI